MKKNLLLLAFVMLLFVSCNKAPQKAELPKYWLWSGYNESQNWEERCAKMQKAGFKGLLLGASEEGYKKVIPIAAKYGIDVHAWLWILNTSNAVAEEHPEWMSVNRNGKSLAEEKAYVDYYKFMCPILPEVREYIRASMDKICKIEGLKGISLDYCRYVDVILPEALWVNYGIVQDKEYAEWDYGYHPAMIEQFKKENGYSPLDKEDPSQDSVWRQFRERQITEVANMVAKVARDNGKMISASPFPSPSVAKQICRQDWGNWELDMAFPMIYYKFYIKQLDWVAERMKENVAIPRFKDAIYCGIYTEDFKVEGADKIEDQMRVAIENGAKGVAIYDYNGLTEEMWSAIGEFIRNNP